MGTWGEVLSAHPHPPPTAQIVGGGQGSLSSDGRTSWDSGCPAPASTCTSHSLPESLVPSTTDCPAQLALVSVWRGVGRGGRGGAQPN